MVLENETALYNTQAIQKALDNLSKVTAFTATTAAGSISQQQCAKYGRVITINLWMLNVTTTEETTVATIPTEYAPPAGQRAWCRPGGAGSAPYAYISEYGNIVVSGGANGLTVLNFAYIAKEDA